MQNVCGDATLPVTPELRGITPLIDPDVDVAGAVAALSASSAANPLDATGLSVFDLLDQAGLGDLVVSQAAAGGAAAGAGNNNNNQQANNNNNNNNNQQANNNQQQQQAPAAEDVANACDNVADDNQDAQQDAPADEEVANDNSNQQAAAGTLAGADFGLCTPTITFQGGEGNRPATEFTFQIADPLARGGQGEALNPNIITNALCNQLTNVCEANDAAKAACEDAKAQVEAAGTRNKSTADLFNSLLGFAGAVTNPAGGPDDVPAAGAKGRMMRRGTRAL